MDVHVEIDQISNGYMLSVYDGDGLAEKDQIRYYPSFNQAVKAAKEWVKTIKATEEERRILLRVSGV